MNTQGGGGGKRSMASRLGAKTGRAGSRGGKGKGRRGSPYGNKRNNNNNTSSPLSGFNPGKAPANNPFGALSSTGGAGAGTGGFNGGFQPSAPTFGTTGATGFGLTPATFQPGSSSSFGNNANQLPSSGFTPATGNKNNNNNSNPWAGANSMAGFGGKPAGNNNNNNNTGNKNNRRQGGGNQGNQHTDTIYVLNLPHDVSSTARLRNHFSQFGNIKNAELTKNNQGIVQFANASEATQAMRMGSTYGPTGHQMTIRPYKPKQGGNEGSAGGGNVPGSSGGKSGKKEPCRFFGTAQGCKNGQNCQYEHSTATSGFGLGSGGGGGTSSAGGVTFGLTSQQGPPMGFASSSAITFGKPTGVGSTGFAGGSGFKPGAFTTTTTTTTATTGASSGFTVTGSTPAQPTTFTGLGAGPTTSTTSNSNAMFMASAATTPSFGRTSAISGFASSASAASGGNMSSNNRFPSGNTSGGNGSGKGGGNKPSFVSKHKARQDSLNPAASPYKPLSSVGDVSSRGTTPTNTSNAEGSSEGTRRGRGRIKRPGKTDGKRVPITLQPVVPQLPSPVFDNTQDSFNDSGGDQEGGDDDEGEDDEEDGAEVEDYSNVVFPEEDETDSAVASVGQRRQHQRRDAITEGTTTPATLPPRMIPPKKLIGSSSLAGPSTGGAAGGSLLSGQMNVAGAGVTASAERLSRFAAHESGDREVLKQQLKQEIELARAQRKAEAARVGAANLNALVGTCMTMCPVAEMIEREDAKEVSPFELVQGTSYAQHNARMDPDLAVKKYHRSAACQEDATPGEVRPPEVLKKTMLHLICNVLDSETRPFWEVHHFVRDRSRSVRTDLTYQHITDKDAVDITELCTRFHILSQHRLCEEDVEKFPAYMNIEQMKKCLTTLGHLYNDLRQEGVHCPNEPEFQCYRLLTQLPRYAHDEDEMMKLLLALPADIVASEPVQLAINAQVAIKSNNYVRFFKLVKSATYLQACLMHARFKEVRESALHVLNSSYRQPFPLTDLCSLLLFDSSEEAAEFVSHYGLQVNDDGAVVLHDMKNTPSVVVPSEPYPPHMSRLGIESKAQGISNSTLVLGSLEARQAIGDYKFVVEDTAPALQPQVATSLPFKGLSPEELAAKREKEEAERKARAEAERVRLEREAMERKAREEAERKALEEREAREKKEREEADRKAKAEAEAARQAEEEKQTKLAAAITAAVTSAVEQAEQQTTDSLYDEAVDKTVKRKVDQELFVERIRKDHGEQMRHKRQVMFEEWRRLAEEHRVYRRAQERAERCRLAIMQFRFTRWRAIVALVLRERRRIEAERKAEEEKKAKFYEMYSKASPLYSSPTPLPPQRAAAATTTPGTTDSPFARSPFKASPVVVPPLPDIMDTSAPEERINDEWRWHDLLEEISQVEEVVSRPFDLATFARSAESERRSKSWKLALLCMPPDENTNDVCKSASLSAVHDNIRQWIESKFSRGAVPHTQEEPSKVLSQYTVDCSQCLDANDLSMQVPDVDMTSSVGLASVTMESSPHVRARAKPDDLSVCVRSYALATKTISTTALTRDLRGTDAILVTVLVDDNDVVLSDGKQLSALISSLHTGARVPIAVVPIHVSQHQHRAQKDSELSHATLTIPGLPSTQTTSHRIANVKYFHACMSQAPTGARQVRQTLHSVINDALSRALVSLFERQRSKELVHVYLRDCVELQIDPILQRAFQGFYAHDTDETNPLGIVQRLNARLNQVLTAVKVLASQIRQVEPWDVAPEFKQGLVTNQRHDVPATKRTVTENDTRGERWSDPTVWHAYAEAIETILLPEFGLAGYGTGSFKEQIRTCLSYVKKCTQRGKAEFSATASRILRLLQGHVRRTQGHGLGQGRDKCLGESDVPLPWHAVIEALVRDRISTANHIDDHVTLPPLDHPTLGVSVHHLVSDPEQDGDLQADWKQVARQVSGSVNDSTPKRSARHSIENEASLYDSNTVIDVDVENQSVNQRSLIDGASPAKYSKLGTGPRHASPMPVAASSNLDSSLLSRTPRQLQGHIERGVDRERPRAYEQGLGSASLEQILLAKRQRQVLSAHLEQAKREEEAYEAQLRLWASKGMVDDDEDLMATDIPVTPPPAPRSSHSGYDHHSVSTPNPGYVGGQSPLKRGDLDSTLSQLLRAISDAKQESHEFSDVLNASLEAVYPAIDSDKKQGMTRVSHV